MLCQTTGLKQNCLDSNCEEDIFVTCLRQKPYEISYDYKRTKISFSVNRPLAYVVSQQNRIATSLWANFFVITSSKFCIALGILEHVMVMAHTSILSHLLQKVDVVLRTAVGRVNNNLQSLMKPCRDVSNNDATPCDFPQDLLILIL